MPPNSGVRLHMLYVPVKCYRRYSPLLHKCCNGFLAVTSSNVVFSLFVGWVSKQGIGVIKLQQLA